MSRRCGNDTTGATDNQVDVVVEYIALTAEEVGVSLQGTAFEIEASVLIVRQVGILSAEESNILEDVLVAGIFEGSSTAIEVGHTVFQGDVLHVGIGHR